MNFITSNFYIMLEKYITELKKVVKCVYTQDYMKASEIFRSILPEIYSMNVVKSNPDTDLNNIVSCILTALENKDMLLFSDYISEGLIPLLNGFIESEDPIEIGDYSVELTSSGYCTIKDIRENIYIHSNSDPVMEANILVENIFDPEKSKYIVWGLGLGYHIEQLVQISMGATDIHVYDDKKELLNISLKYGVTKSIQENFVFHYDPDGKLFSKSLTEKKTGVLLHYPSIKTIRNQHWKKSIEKLYMGWNGTTQFKKALAINFRKNHELIHKNVDEICKDITEKEVFLVAAGPSLDDSLEVLKNKRKEDIIVSVGTVLKKLIELSITTDFTVVMDPQARTIKQIEGIENTRIPMIIGSTAYWEFADRYQGEKYISYQKDYDLSEKKAREGGYNLYATGGSVTTLALSLLLRMGAKRINLVGVDMAFPNGRSHAQNTMDQKKIDCTGMEMVGSVSGESLYTDKKMLSYLRWIENEIAKYPQIEVYNYSKIGAKIKGTKNPYEIIGDA